MALNSIPDLLCFVSGVDYNWNIWENAISHIITTISWAAPSCIKRGTPVFALAQKENFFSV